MSTFARWTLGCTIAILVTVVPFFYYRWCYTYSKRLREIVPGRVYRSGQLTADGFAEAVKRYHFRTIVNLQDDFPNPDIWLNYFTLDTLTEYEMCKRLGVRFVAIAPDTISRRDAAAHPEAIDRFLEIMDDPDSYPVLFHCRAGLHRTGCMAAVYRMEYQGWTPRQALLEMKANGFGEFACTSANDYVQEYVLAYQPRGRQQP